MILGRWGTYIELALVGSTFRTPQRAPASARYRAELHLNRCRSDATQRPFEEIVETIPIAKLLRNLSEKLQYFECILSCSYLINAISPESWLAQHALLDASHTRTTT